jgi:hypothetical protein
MAYNKEYAKQYYLDNKEKMLAYNYKWQSDNRDKMREYNKAYKSKDNEKYQQYCKSNYAMWLLSNAKRAEKDRGIPCNLDISDIIIPTHCPYLGFELTTIRGAGQLDTNASIDKINPKLGYTKGNVEIISRKANRMKNNASPKELILFAESVLNRKDIFISRYND